MKKTVLLLLLVTHTASLLCMDTQLDDFTDAKDSNQLYIKERTDESNAYFHSPKYQKPNYQSLSKEQYMVQLYQDSCAIIQAYNSNTLFNFITNFNNGTKKHAIHEDDMSQFAYHREQNPINLKTVAFFGYLKHYTMAIKKTLEPIPSSDDLIKQKTITIIKNHLAQNLNLPSVKNTTTTTYTYDEDTAEKLYPAFNTLRYKAITIKKLSDLSPFLRYIHSQPMPIQNNYEEMSFDRLKGYFYKEASNLIEGFDANIDAVLQIIEAGKNLNLQKKESDFAREILNTQSTCTQKVGLTCFGDIRPYMMKKRIGILSVLIERYNNERATKITPTEKQYLAYQHRLQGFTLPDSFDSSLFDNSIYAFDELKKLLDSNSTLRSVFYPDINECFNQLFTKPY